MKKAAGNSDLPSSRLRTAKIIESLHSDLKLDQMGHLDLYNDLEAVVRADPIVDERVLLRALRCQQHKVGAWGSILLDGYLPLSLGKLMEISKEHGRLLQHFVTVIHRLLEDTEFLLHRIEQRVSVLLEDKQFGETKLVQMARVVQHLCSLPKESASFRPDARLINYSNAIEEAAMEHSLQKDTIVSEVKCVQLLIFCFPECPLLQLLSLRQSGSGEGKGAWPASSICLAPLLTAAQMLGMRWLQTAAPTLRPQDHPAATWPPAR
jgi:hypothetical protein